MKTSSPMSPRSRGVSLLRRTSSLGRILTLASLTAAVAPAATVETIATGLNNPRGLDFAPNGALYVAEAGTGGGPTAPSIEGPEGPVHFGLTGSVTRIFRGAQDRVALKLPSLAAADGSGAIGPSAISFSGTGNALLTVGLGADPAARSLLPAAAAGLGWLYQMNQNGQVKAIADLAGFEGKTNADGNLPDSNPNGVHGDRGGDAFVTDAGANTLLRVDNKGTPSIVAVFPNRDVPAPPFLPQPTFSMQAVPTNVVRGPDGALYVSQLTGFPFPLGGARVYRVVPGSAPQIYADGFTNIIDLAFDSQGRLYVLEIDANSLLTPGENGRLARVPAGGGAAETIVSTGLIMPGGLVIGPDGAIYISNYSVVPGGGRVERVTP